MDQSTLRHRAFLLLEPRATASLSGRIVDVFITALIGLNVLAVAAESVDSLHATYRDVFYYFELVSVIIFTVEYLSRLWCAMEMPRFRDMGALKGRLRYALTPLLITDLVVLLPFYFTVLGIGVDLRFLRVVRLRRGFRLTRYATGLKLINEVVQQELRTFLAVAFVALLMIIGGSSALYVAETNAQPEVFSSIPATMWWAVNTLTTVGQSQVAPITPVGKLFGGLISLVGVILVGMTAGVMGSAFTAAARQRRRAYELKLEAYFRETGSSDGSREALAGAANELGLRPLQTEAIHADFSEHKLTHKHCSHCGAEL